MLEFFRAGSWQNGFFADFYFRAAGFFRGFSRRIFSPHFCGEKVPRKILQENPRQNPPKLIQQKSPTHFCRGAGPKFCSISFRWMRKENCAFTQAASIPSRRQSENAGPRLFGFYIRHLLKRHLTLSDWISRFWGTPIFRPKIPKFGLPQMALRAQRFKKFKIALRDWNFQSRLKISSEPPSKPLLFVGNSQGQDWKFQSRLKISSEIEIFNRDWIFSIFGPLGGGVTNGGLRGAWPPFPEMGRNRPLSPFFCLFRPFPERTKST